jgi:hypothetical protein
MTFLPIVRRELRIGSRRRSTYRTRWLAALLACVLVSGALILSGRLTTSTPPGESLFKLLASLAFIYCLLEGLRNTADCLSEEKREGTLGLLFLTDLKGYDVVLGKLLATSLASFYGLLAVFPAFAISFILGGVTAGEVWRMALVLMNTLFLSLSLGMWVSAISQQARKAWTAVFCLMGLIVVAPLLLELFWPATLQRLGQVLGSLSPASDFKWAFDGEYSRGAKRYWISLVLIHLLAWSFLALASRALPHSWKTGRSEDIQRSSNRFWPLAWENQLQTQMRRNPNHPLIEFNPVLWLAERNNRHRQFLWIFVVVAAGAELAFWLLSDAGRKEVGLLNISSVFLLHLAFRLWMASQACHSLAEARSSGLLELMLSTPLKSSEIIQGQIMALKRTFRVPVIALLGLEAAFLLGSFFSSVNSGQDALAFAVVGVLVGASMITFVADLVALGWVGMWLGLTSKKTNQATMKTIFFVLALPWLAFFLIPLFGVLVWIFWPVVDLAWISWAQNKLSQNFRYLAANRLEFGQSKADWLPGRRAGKSFQPPPVLGR